MVTTFSLIGYLVGHIWMPNAECWKDLNYDLESEQARTDGRMTLRDHILRASNDGDFQSCGIARGFLVARRECVRGGRRVVTYRQWELDRFPSIADCLHDDPEWFPTYAEDLEDA